jgi:hypothetical protein
MFSVSHSAIMSFKSVGILAKVEWRKGNILRYANYLVCHEEMCEGAKLAFQSMLRARETSIITLVSRRRAVLVRPFS